MWNVPVAWNRFAEIVLPWITAWGAMPRYALHASGRPAKVVAPSGHWLWMR